MSGLECRFAVTVLLGLAVAAGPVMAQPYPTKPVRIVTPAAPGGGTDFTARVLAQKLGERLGQQFIVDNRGGVGGIIGVGHAAKAAPDGYTLLLGFAGPLAMTPHADAVGYDPRKDFIGVSLLTMYYLLLVSHPSLPARSVKELIALAKAHPGKLNYASGNLWSPTHLGPELFKMVAGVDILSVPYKGTGSGVNAVIVGDAHMLYASPPGLLPHVRAKRLVALGVAGPTRLRTDPDIPTFAESGLRGADTPSWQALLAPAATPREIVMKLNGEVVSLNTQSDYRATFDKLSLDTRTTTPDEFAAFLGAEYDRWGKVIREMKRKTAALR